MNPRLSLYFSPGACSRVPMLTLLECGIDFEPILLRFMAGEARSETFLAKNPKAKVPVLIAGEGVITENAAILYWLSRNFGDQRVLPFNGDVYHDARIIADLSWCASGLHPLVSRLRVPMLIVQGADAQASLYSVATEAMHREFAILDKRLQERDWLYGAWSALDAYVYWVVWRAAGAGFDASAYPNVLRHAAAMAQLDSTHRLSAIEADAEAALARDGMSLPMNKRV